MATNSRVATPAGTPAAAPAGDGGISFDALLGADADGGVGDEDLGGEDDAPADDAPDTDTDDDDAPEDKPELKASSAVDKFLGGEQPEWLATLVDDEGELTISDEEFENLPIEAKKLVAVMVRRGKATQAALEAKLDAQRVAEEALKRRELDAADLATDAFKAFRDPALQAFVEKLKPKGPVPDPDSPEGIQYRIDSAVAKHLGDWMQALQAADTGVTEQAKAARAKAENEKQVQELQTYMEANREDFETPRIFQAVKSLVDRSGGKITAQEAHKLVMGQALLESDDDRKEQLERARRAVRPGGRNGRQVPRMPAHLVGDSAGEADWYAAHPDAMRRDMDEAMRASDYQTIAREERRGADKRTG